MTCTESAHVHRKYADMQVINILNPYADNDVVPISEVFVLRCAQIPHSRYLKYSPCRRISINTGAIHMLGCIWYAVAPCNRA